MSLDSPEQHKNKNADYSMLGLLANVIGKDKYTPNNWYIPGPMVDNLGV